MHSTDKHGFVIGEGTIPLDNRASIMFWFEQVCTLLVLTEWSLVMFLCDGLFSHWTLLFS